KAIPNCSDSQKVPLTWIYSAPDSIQDGITNGGYTPFYQPTWEYGNLFSYPVNIEQLKALVPGFKLLTSNTQPAFSVSGVARSTISASWGSGQASGSKAGFTQN